MTKKKKIKTLDQVIKSEPIHLYKNMNYTTFHTQLKI